AARYCFGPTTEPEGGHVSDVPTTPMTTARIGILAVTLAFGSIGCRGSHEPPAPPPPKVTVSRPLDREIVEWDEYTGRLQATDSLEVRARVSGYLESIHFADGAIVKEGDLLFVIDPRPYEAELARAQADLQSAKARVAVAGTELTRTKSLLPSHAASQEQAESRSAIAQQAAAPLAAAQAAVTAAALNVEFTHVKAPMAGRAGRHLVTEGNLVQGGSSPTLLTTIVALDPIHCYFEADERAYLKYSRLAKNGQRPSSRDVKTRSRSASLTSRASRTRAGWTSSITSSTPGRARWSAVRSSRIPT